MRSVGPSSKRCRACRNPSQEGVFSRIKIVMFSAGLFTPAVGGSQEHVSSDAVRLQDLPRSRMAPSLLPDPDPPSVLSNRYQSLLLTLVSGGFLLSGSNTVNVARTLAVSPANSGATGSWRPGKTQLMAQARPGSFFALACGKIGLAAGRSIPCQAVKRRSSSTVKLGIAVLFSEPPGP